MRDLYIYYKVPAARARALWPRVQAMQATLLARHGVAGTLRRRPEIHDGRQTWMEIYPAAPADIDALLAHALEAAQLSQELDGARHTEVFTDDSPCA